MHSVFRLRGYRTFGDSALKVKQSRGKAVCGRMLEFALKSTMKVLNIFNNSVYQE
jgi:hypothetical protein